MKLNPFLQELEKSKEYLDFKTKYPNAYLAAGFFVLDFENNANLYQIDFFIPGEKKVAAFTLGKEVKLQLLDLLNEQVPEPLSPEATIDLDSLKGILLDEMHNRGMSEEIKKLIAVIQNIDGKSLWSLNCVLSGMEILKSHVEDATQSVLKIEKKSLLEVMKHLPVQKFEKKLPVAKEEIEKEIENLSKLEKEIEAEKERLRSDIDKKKELTP